MEWPSFLKKKDETPAASEQEVQTELYNWLKQNGNERVLVNQASDGVIEIHARAGMSAVGGGVPMLGDKFASVRIENGRITLERDGYKTETHKLANVWDVKRELSKLMESIYFGHGR